MLQRFFQQIMYNGLEAIGRYYSVYRGHVIDNNDPENLGRLKVLVPSIIGRKEHPSWVYPRNSVSGNGYGIQVLPQKGDLVMVEFEHGDPKFPIWSHAHFTENQKPEEFVNAQVYGFKSPKGQLVIIDDRDGEVYVQVVDAHGISQDYETPIVAFNGGENAGLVKVKELTEKLNAIEKKVNDFLADYRPHTHIDPISGFTGPHKTPPTIPLDIDETNQSEIENNKVLH